MDWLLIAQICPLLSFLSLLIFWYYATKIIDSRYLKRREPKITDLIILPRRMGKTTKALELLRDNEKSLMFTYGPLRIDHPILEQHPELKNRILGPWDMQHKLRGKTGYSINMIIVDDAEFFDTQNLEEIRIFQQISNLPVKVVLTMTLEEDINRPKESRILGIFKICT